jgi:hypothetical protein
MTWTLWTRQEIALITAILTLACVAAFLSVKLTRPKPFASAALSSQWQCTTAAGTTKIGIRKPAWAQMAALA